MPKRVPIRSAKTFAAENGLRQVIIAAWDGELTHIVTYGETSEDCDQAAMGGDAIKRALGWPEALNSKPSRLRAAEREATALRTALAAAEQKLASVEEALNRELNVNDEELLRIRNGVKSDGDVKIWGKMLLKIVDSVRHARTALQLNHGKTDGR